MKEGEYFDGWLEWAIERNDYVNPSNDEYENDNDNLKSEEIIIESFYVGLIATWDFILDFNDT